MRYAKFCYLVLAVAATGLALVLAGALGVTGAGLFARFAGHRWWTLLATAFWIGCICCAGWNIYRRSRHAEDISVGDSLDAGRPNLYDKRALSKYDQ